MFHATLSRNFLVKQCSTTLFAQGIRSFSTRINFDDLVKKSKVVVFMKGTPKSPMCGFSKLVVQILNLHGVDYDAYDVLSDDNLRKGIKEYTSWPTIPQVFINGEFVGGCDILRSMHYDNKLIEELQKAGIKSALSESSRTEKSAEQNLYGSLMLMFPFLGVALITSQRSSAKFKNDFLIGK